MSLTFSKHCGACCVVCWSKAYNDHTMYKIHISYVYLLWYNIETTDFILSLLQPSCVSSKNENHAPRWPRCCWPIASSGSLGTRWWSNLTHEKWGVVQWMLFQCESNLDGNWNVPNVSFKKLELFRDLETECVSTTVWQYRIDGWIDVETQPQKTLQSHKACATWYEWDFPWHPSMLKNF